MPLELYIVVVISAALIFNYGYFCGAHHRHGSEMRALWLAKRLEDQLNTSIELVNELNITKQDYDAWLAEYRADEPV